MLGWVTTYEYPCCNKLFFFSFFPIPFQGKPAELQHCVMSFLLHVFIINLLVISPCPYLPVFIYNIIGETLTSNTHRAIISEYWASLLRLRNITNKSESSNYTANGDLAIKSGFVNVVSSAILNSQAGTAVHSFPDSRSPFPIPRSQF